MFGNSKNSAQSSAQAQALQAVADLEIEMMTDTYRRMSQSCQSKCINTSYREPELLKGFLKSFLKFFQLLIFIIR
jgi:hypothetical protein